MVQEDMRSKEFIVEDLKTEVLLSMKQINAIHGECAIFLQNASTPLFRGVNRNSQRPGLSKVPIRTNRIPADLKGYSTAAFNYIFEMKTGIPYIRNSTAFATNRIEVARAYGSPVLVFPINGTKYIRSNEINDIFTKLNDDHFEYLEDVYFRKLKTEDEQQDFRRSVSKFHQLMDTNAGQYTKSEIDKIFGKYLPLWQIYIKSITSLIDTYTVYDEYTPELDNATEEIAMFGMPYYYTLALGLFSMRFNNPATTIYIDGVEFDGVNRVEYVVFDAVKNKHEIHARTKT